MLTPSATFWVVIFSILSTILAIYAFITSLKQFQPVLKKFKVDNSPFVAVLKTLGVVLWPLLLVLALTAGIGFAIHEFGMMPETDIEATATPTTVISTPQPSLIANPSTLSLDDLQVLNKEPDKSFFFHQWEKNFPIKIDGIEYLHSIGAQLPVDVKYDLITNHATEREDYSAMIEYSLGYKYEKFQFSYGIDDNAFKDAGLPPPNCHYWIVVESCICREDAEEKSKEIYRTPEVNYMQTIETSDFINVSNVETLRITFYWKFDVLPTKPLTLNVAIVDPTLYVKAK